MFDLCGSQGGNRHQQVFGDERLVPIVAFYYCLIRLRRGAQSVTVLSARIRDSRYTFAHALPHKGVYVHDLTTRLANELEQVGLRGKVIVKSDNEAATMRILDEVSRVRASRGQRLYQKQAQQGTVSPTAWQNAQ